MKKIVFASIFLLLFSLTSIAQTQTQNLNMGLYQLQFPSANGGYNRIQSFGGTFPGTWLFKSRFDNITLDAGENSGNRYKILFLSGGIERARMDGDGRFGIGTTSPSAKLHLVDPGNSGVTTLQLNNRFKFRGDGVLDWGASANAGRLSWDANKVIIGGQTGKDLSLIAGGGEKLIVKTNGNVGIGTTNPQEKLEVKGKIYLNSGPDDDGIYWAKHNMTMGTIPGSYNHNVFRLKPGGSSNGFLYSRLEMYTANSETAHNKTIQIHSSGTSYLNGGNVGIGTTAPDAKLAVNGNIHAKEVKIDLIGWPDYVFESDYNLPTLQEVEHHIAEKGHLENIPSAAEVSENGIQLGDMNAKLLQKIEELTLYMIEQNKKTEQLQKEVTALQKKNIELEKKIK